MLFGNAYVIDMFSVACSLILGSLLLIAAAAKTLNRSAFRDAVTAFGLRSLPAGLVFSLPVAEAMIGFGLIAGIFPRTIALAAFLLLLVFTAVVTASVLRGESHDCNCFGSLAQSKVGWPLVYRNLALLALALFLIAVPSVESHHVVNRWFTDRLSRNSLAWILSLSTVVVIESLLLLDTLPRLVAVTSLGERKRATKKVPSIIAFGTKGDEKDLSQIVRSFPQTLLLFLSPTCKLCETLAAPLRALRSVQASLQVVLLSHGDVELNNQYAARHGYDEILILSDVSVLEQLGIKSTPSALFATANGFITTGVLQGPGAILQALQERNMQADLITAV